MHQKLDWLVILCESGLTTAEVPCAGNGGCSDSCAVIDGLEQCFCPSGFVLNRFDKQACVGKLFSLSPKWSRRRLG